jgi:hypothetical protein
MRHARRQAREVALQALYAWQLSGGDPLEEARSNEAYEKTVILEELVRGVCASAAELEGLIAPHLDRAFSRLSPSARDRYIGPARHREDALQVVLNGRSSSAKLQRHRRLSLNRGVLRKISCADAAAGKSLRSEKSLLQIRIIKRYFDRPPKRALGVGDDCAAARTRARPHSDTDC